MKDKEYFKYWGKASKEDSRYHLLPYHCLDVAAVGYQLLNQSSSMVQNLSAMTGMEEKLFIHWMTFFLALHDLGKFSSSFQNLREDILCVLQKRKIEHVYTKRHDTLGYLFWQGVLKQELATQGVFKIAGGRRQSNDELTFDFWMLAVTGHHGQPPEGISDIMLRDMFDQQDIDAILSFVNDIKQLLLGDDYRFPLLDSEQIKQASWWLSGFTVLCDWLGSGRITDEYVSQPMHLSDYWRQAMSWAEEVIRKNEIIPAQPVNKLELSQLFGAHIKGEIELTPLQQEVSQVEISHEPQLFILEDVTGAGKTEAAMILLHRLMASGQNNGFYFGLPTMATANAMYQRMADVYQKLYSSETLPSLVLAHSASKLNEQFRQSFKPFIHSENNEYGDGLEPASSHCSGWLADNRKKALLADAGVGTIDQALLAVLPSRHQSLRLLGLLGKVLLVDEVHACDAYMHTLLCGLLKAHSRAGGSVILLSATLPQYQRQQLVDAFTSGLQSQQLTLTKTTLDDYPLISHAQVNVLNEIKVSTRSSVKRKVKVSVLENELEVIDTIANALQQGQCVCWIRNTVNDARQALSRFQSEHPQYSAHLFHARYAMGDRLNIEQDVLQRFGPDSDESRRQGQLLIATQVVEQSLDLDFDLLITDLAPIDLIIQRAGRLRRHQRDKKGDRIQQPDQRGVAEIIIYTPPWQEQPQPDWLKATMPGTAAVYENQDGQLWQGLKLLKQAGEFNMPEDARKLIEGVYGEQVQLPDGLTEAALQQLANRMAESGQGRMNLLKLELGYRREEQNIWWDEACTPTRLGEETTTVYLARWQDNQLTPWMAHGINQWANSALNLRKAIIAKEAVQPEIPESVIEEIKHQLPAQGKFGVLLPLQLVDDLWMGVAQNANGDEMKFYYHKQHGLLQAREYEEMEVIS